MEKARQEMYEDNKEGDTIAQERKTTKANPPYDPQPHTAEAVQIVGKRREEMKVLDKQQWKKVEIRPVSRFTETGQETGEEDPDIGLPVTYQSGPGDASQRHQAEGAGQGQPSVDPDTGIPVTHQSDQGDTDQHYQAEGAGQSQLLAAGEEGACKARQQGKMEFLTTQELDREAQQTTDQVGGSLERER